MVTISDGSSAEQAVVIQAPSSALGIPQEYAHVGRVCGRRNIDYQMKMQRQVSQNGRNYDVLEVKLKDGSVRTFWFDITSFFGKL